VVDGNGDRNEKPNWTEMVITAQIAAVRTVRFRNAGGPIKIIAPKVKAKPKNPAINAPRLNESITPSQPITDARVTAARTAFRRAYIEMTQSTGSAVIKSSAYLEKRSRILPSTAVNSGDVRYSSRQSEPRINAVQKNVEVMNAAPRPFINKYRQ